MSPVGSLTFSSYTPGNCKYISFFKLLAQRPGELSFYDGDLILLTNPVTDPDPKTHVEVSAVNERTGDIGDVRLDRIYRLPTLARPSNDLLVRLFFNSNSFQLKFKLKTDSCHNTNFGMTHDDAHKWKHFPRYWLLCEEFTGHRWIPLTKASDAELSCSLWPVPE